MREIMVNSLKHNEGFSKLAVSSANGDLLSAINTSTKQFSRDVEFVGLDYETRREKVEEITDVLVDILSNEKLYLWNAFMSFLKEIIKNSADHSGSNMKIEISIHKDIEHEKGYIKFLLCDGGPGLPVEEGDIDETFTDGKRKTLGDWEKKGKFNFGIGLGMIKAITEIIPIDLVLHNRGKLHRLSDAGLQADFSSRNDFGYEGLAMFDFA
ncbi:MAG: ATP-binding protein [candidate division SR1 bacterium]|nr:ATP-binding protein [candidate division SR1 bacterium]